MGQKQEFSTFDVLKILDIKRERLREWMAQGFIKPTSPAEGQGTKAVFTILDVYKIAVFKKLVEAGINRKKASILVDTSPTLNSIEKVKSVNFFSVLLEEGRTEFCSYFEPPWTLEQYIMENPNWNFGILINLKKLRETITESI